MDQALLIALIVSVLLPLILFAVLLQKQRRSEGSTGSVRPRHFPTNYAIKLR